MKALVFKPSGESIGTFDIVGTEEVPEKLETFLEGGARTPLHSYVEAGGETWTIVGLKPTRLREGSVAGRLAKTQEKRSRGIARDGVEEARGRMKAGLCLFLGGVVVTGGSYAFAVSIPGMTHYLVASGLIFWGGVMALTNFVKISRAKRRR